MFWGSVRWSKDARKCRSSPRNVAFFSAHFLVYFALNVLGEENSIGTTLHGQGKELESSLILFCETFFLKVIRSSEVSSTAQ